MKTTTLQATNHTSTTDNNKQHHLPRTPDEYEKYLADKFSRIVNSPYFAVYEGFLEEYYRTPQEGDEFPGWVLPMRNDIVIADDVGDTVVTPCFCLQLVAHSCKQANGAEERKTAF